MRFEQLEQAASAFRRDHASRFGAALAFYIVLSIAPIAVIAIAAAAMILGRRPADGAISNPTAAISGRRPKEAASPITGKYASHDLLGGEPLWQILQLIVSVVVLTILAATIFRYIPTARVPWHDVLPGAAFTATFFVIGKFALGLYLRKAAVG